MSLTRTKLTRRTVSLRAGAIAYRIWLDEFGPMETPGAFRRARIAQQAKAAAKALRTSPSLGIEELARILHRANPYAAPWDDLGVPGTYRRRARQALGLDAPARAI
ncbi:hypothetical protein Bequi_09965 [Brachybacterium sp. JHP9]|uniref:Integrase n=1 Tax=Brachybacterium equifaecis TaxID=2910770 RepID=A0ABT0R384_9MICO|nr:hypothetical protein [Brachybacterium equifaecis]MCL6423709.1 hypothetical protein [Brachybacterium equifaecis]